MLHGLGSGFVETLKAKHASHISFIHSDLEITRGIKEGKVSPGCTLA